MKETHYTEAVLALLEEGKEVRSVLKGLKETLEHRGHEALLPRILRRVQRALEEGQVHAGVTAYIAREEDQKKCKKAITEFAGDMPVVYHTDETLIGGYVARKESVQVDASHKRLLTELYRDIISTT